MSSSSCRGANEAHRRLSDAMKFHHLGLLLLDSNCLLLLLKMFGLQEVSTAVISKADSPDNKCDTQSSRSSKLSLTLCCSFFSYCLLNFSSRQQNVRPEEEMPRPSRRTEQRERELPNGIRVQEEVEFVTDYSWRNFFSNINYAKIMQKLSKHLSFRICMLVTYKSSVSG